MAIRFKTQYDKRGLFKTKMLKRWIPCDSPRDLARHTDENQHDIYYAPKLRRGSVKPKETNLS
ncbi:hypothetical protein OAL00_06765 [Verrucomicrobiales bacterium]|nr:hypothetical protein [Verrucomicrobiales bacterium]